MWQFELLTHAQDAVFLHVHTRPVAEEQSAMDTQTLRQPTVPALEQQATGQLIPQELQPANTTAPVRKGKAPQKRMKCLYNHVHDYF